MKLTLNEQSQKLKTLSQQNEKNATIEHSTRQQQVFHLLTRKFGELYIEVK
jgi:hypothetical protein